MNTIKTFIHIIEHKDDMKHYIEASERIASRYWKDKHYLTIIQTTN